MFKYKFVILISLLVLTGMSAYADMSDQQVLDYILTAAKMGKSQQQIGKELVVRGVTETQLQRVKDLYEKRTGQDGKVTQGVSTTSSQQYRISDTEQGVGYFVDENNDSELKAVKQENNEKRVYGRGFFDNRRLTFEPNVNTATPEDYRLGPGDEVVINIWGDNEAVIRDYISPEGTIIVSNIGPVSLSGMTIKEANRYLKNVFAQKYAGIADDGSDINLVLGNMRTIQVDIMGEVNTPGTYRLSPFSTLFHALYNAGGTNDTGTMRDIAVYRNGKKIISADIYDYLFNGKTSSDIRLQEGDVILVSPYNKLVTIESGVKRPMTYELKNGETILDIINYAGGLTGNAFSDRLNIQRSLGEGMSVLTVEAKDFANTQLYDGDIIEIGGGINRFDNRIEIKGAVFRPGTYALGQEISTLKDLINIADGITEDAYTGRVQIFRQAPDLTQIIESVDLGSIMSGLAPDFKLQPNDIVMVPSVLELMPKGDVLITGAVGHPGSYPFAAGTTVEDLIVQAGGLLEGASEAKIDISRRIVDSESTEVTPQIAQTYSVTLKDGLVVNGDQGFVLQPNDIVDVRFSPSFIEQRRVSVAGEVVFPGSYTLNNRAERISDLVKQAGGVSEFAYLKGANLRRTYTRDELRQREEIRKLINSSDDEEEILSQDATFNMTVYPVGINLEAALKNPGGYEDLVLQPGDQLFIPELQNTVKITGAVLYPNSVIYTPGKNLKYYVNQAGGFNNDAKKGSSFVVYMNGQVAKGTGAKIEPGCHIIVPTKVKKDQAADFQKWLSIGTTAASIGTMAAAIVNLVK